MEHPERADETTPTITPDDATPDETSEPPRPPEPSPDRVVEEPDDVGT